MRVPLILRGRRSRMSKIVHVTSAHPATDTRVFLKQCRGLAAAGHEVVLVVADAGGNRWVDGVQVRSVGMPRSRGDRMLRVSWACVRQALQEAGIDYDSAEASWVPNLQVPLDLDGAKKMIRVIDALEDSDDVQNVYANGDIPDDVLTELDNEE